ncbi:metalloprotease [Ophidiomyces ophidiicola]|nr:metalloprotease [Ophidiomyces ophidiicola]KAI1987222.1 metalloprotease [Ophidiomyces ophidiicola]KAI1998367.1 metalloprotease [Ophidiomyces ophidiicola]KAI2000934.1 metalloprotease [Ophidiomyces ophidiicola]
MASLPSPAAAASSLSSSMSLQDLEAMTLVERVADNVEKPVVDDRSYRVIKLANKLEALLVHDPNTDKASASVNVNVGNFSDADDMPGMAHAVEHLLFMGTEKYPGENDYNQYLAAHSGHSNAYTAATETNYYFEVAATAHSHPVDAEPAVVPTPSETPAPLGPLVDRRSSTVEESASTTNSPESPLFGALDRFAQFFICPLFLPSTLERELRAVDSENKKNLQSDPWRLSQLNKSLSNPNHPYHHFSTGNLQTLLEEPQKRGLDVRQEFIDFHTKHYSSNRMKLVVLGRESLDQLERWVIHLFSDVKNKELSQNRWDDVQPFAPDDMRKIIYAKPVMDMRSLDIFFVYQDEEFMYDSQPSRYISHLIGHEGPGSILAHIKAKGWATELSAGPIPVCPGSSFFNISVRLTEDGLHHYEDVVKVIFQYISLIKENAPEEWIFEEMKNLSEVDFRFKQKSPASRFTSSLSSVMQRPYPREWLISSSLLRKFEPELITKGLTYLNADNFNIELISQKYPGDWDRKEKWYGTEYKVEPISDNVLSEIRSMLESPSTGNVSELHLPHRNEFVPTRLDVEKKEVEKPTQVPSLIRNDDRVRTWFKKDDTFWVPKAAVEITMRNPLVYATPGNNVKTRLYCELVRDALTEYSYDAELAGLDYDLTPSVFGLDVSIAGYNDKMSVLLEKVLHSMRDLEVRPERFKIIKERLARGFRNAEYQLPYYQVGSYTRLLTAEKAFINQQLADELEHIEAEDVAAFFPQILRQNHVEVLAHGNIYKEDALQLTDLVESTFKARPLPRSQWHVRRNLIIPPGSNYIYEHTLKDPANVNHCIEYYLFVGDLTDPTLRAKIQLFAQMASEPAFDQLRTKEQLGYVVWSGSRFSATTLGYRVIIQSERDCDYLETRIDAFLSRFAATLESMTDSVFEAHKRSVINKRLEKLKNLSSEIGRYWAHIGSEYYDFLQHETDAEAVKPLTKADIIEFYREFIDPESHSRAKLAVHMKAQATAESVSPVPQKDAVIEGINKFLKSAGIDVETEKMKLAFESVTISKENIGTITETMKSFLTTEMGLVEEQVLSLIERGTQVLEGLFSGDNANATLTNGEGDPKAAPANGVNGINGGESKKPVYITSIPEFKARLSVSPAASPIVDLSEYEDFEPKL